MRIEIPVFYCDVPGCDHTFALPPEARVAVVWREAARTGWCKIILREGTDTSGQKYYLLDLWGTRSNSPMGHGCPQHQPIRGRSTIIIPGKDENAKKPRKKAVKKVVAKKTVRRRNVARSA